MSKKIFAALIVAVVATFAGYNIYPVSYTHLGKYGARLINDTNGNGVWDPGDYEKGIQPEMVYYYPHIIEFKANWDATQDWNVTAVPLDKQKPDELKKQKPDEDKKKKTRDSQNANRNRRNN